MFVTLFLLYSHVGFVVHLVVVVVLGLLPLQQYLYTDFPDPTCHNISWKYYSGESIYSVYFIYGSLKRTKYDSFVVMSIYDRCQYFGN